MGHEAGARVDAKGVGVQSQDGVWPAAFFSLPAPRILQDGTNNVPSSNRDKELIKKAVAWTLGQERAAECLTLDLVQKQQTTPEALGIDGFPAHAYLASIILQIASRGEVTSPLRLPLSLRQGKLIQNIFGPNLDGWPDHVQELKRWLTDPEAPSQQLEQNVRALVEGKYKPLVHLVQAKVVHIMQAYAHTNGLQSYRNGNGKPTEVPVNQLDPDVVANAQFLLQQPNIAIPETKEFLIPVVLAGLKEMRNLMLLEARALASSKESDCELKTGQVPTRSSQAFSVEIDTAFSRDIPKPIFEIIHKVMNSGSEIDKQYLLSAVMQLLEDATEFRAMLGITHKSKQPQAAEPRATRLNPARAKIYSLGVFAAKSYGVNDEAQYPGLLRSMAPVFEADGCNISKADIGLKMLNLVAACLLSPRFDNNDFIANRKQFLDNFFDSLGFALETYHLKPDSEESIEATFQNRKRPNVFQLIEKGVVGPEPKRILASCEQIFDRFKPQH